MGSFFKFGQAVPEIFEFEYSKKGVIFRDDLKGRELTYLKWHQKEDFWRVSCNFLAKNTHNVVKDDPKFEYKSLFDAKFYGAWQKKIKISRSQGSDIWGLGSKNLLRVIGSKAFSKGLIKSLVENPSCNFHKQDLIFSRIMRWIK